MEAEITALRLACIETQAPGDDDSQIRYVAFLRPGEVGEAPDLPTNFSRALNVGWNLSVTTGVKVISPRMDPVVNILPYIN